MPKFIIGFSRAKSFFAIGSKVIQFVERRNFSHVYIMFVDKDSDTEMVAQASHGYVNLVNYEIFCEENIIVEEYEIECNDAQYNDIQKFINRNLGKKYSKMQIFWIGLKKLLHLELKPNVNRDMSFICSEWGSRICQIAKIEINVNLDYITPSDLHQIIITLFEDKRVQ